jgi:phosphonate transport system substrate-binding protein
MPSALWAKTVWLFCQPLKMPDFQRSASPQEQDALSERERNKGVILGFIPRIHIYIRKNDFMDCRNKSGNDISDCFLALKIRLVIGSFLLTCLSLQLTQESYAQESIRIGVYAYQAPAETLTRLEPFRIYLSESIEKPVEIVPQDSWDSLILSMATSRLDYAIVTAGVYAAAMQSCDCVEPLVKPVLPDNAEGYRPMLMSASDGPVFDISDMYGRRLTIVGEGSTVAHRLGLAELQQQNIDPDKQFRSVRYQDTLEEAVQQLLRQGTDAVMTWSLAELDDDLPSPDGGLAYLAAKDESFDVSSIRMIWAGRPVPLALHIVHEDMPAATRESLLEAMLALTPDKEAAFDAVRERLSLEWQVARVQEFTPLLEALYGSVNNNQTTKQPADSSEQNTPPSNSGIQN